MASARERKWPAHVSVHKISYRHRTHANIVTHHAWHLSLHPTAALQHSAAAQAVMAVLRAAP